MTTADTDLKLTVTRHIPAPPERVFDAWLNPEMLCKFMIAGSKAGCLRAESDPRPGGKYFLLMTYEGREIPHPGRYIEVNRPKRLSFTWEVAHAAPGSVVTLDFVPEGSGTHLTLSHVKFTSESRREGHVAGWTAILDHLERAFPRD